MTYYLAETDDNGVLCIERLEATDFRNGAEEGMARLATDFPEIIYFEYTKPVAYWYYAVENDPNVGLCVLPQGLDEDRAVKAAEMNTDVIFFAVEV